MPIRGWFRRLVHWTAHRLLTRTYRITHRLKAELRTVTKSKVLVLAPHIDDEVIAPGGTLWLHREAGSSISVVYISDSAGDPAQTGYATQTAMRKAEAEACARYVGFTIEAFLDFPDGNLCRFERNIAVDLAAMIRRLQPDVILVPFPTDHHRDHQATASALALALETLNWKGQVWGYEVWSTLWPNVVVDISSVVERKKEAIACHVSQIANMNYVEATLGLNRYRGLRVGVALGEAFHVCSGREFPALVRQLLRTI